MLVISCSYNLQVLRNMKVNLNQTVRSVYFIQHLQTDYGRITKTFQESLQNPLDRKSFWLKPHLS